MKPIAQIALLLTATATIPLPAATIGLSLSSNIVGAGSNFTLAVRVTDLASDSLVAFGMNPFISDSSKVAFLSAVVDPAFNDDSGFFGGNPAIAGDAFPPIGTAPVTLATLTFRVLQAGAVNVGVSSNLTDPNQGLFLLGGVQDLSTSAAVNVVAPDPSTATLLILGLGVCYARFQKCRRERDQDRA